MRNKSDVIIVGAGASGLVAGISAARLGASVIILEHMGQPGKKLLATGNGKCNFTNTEQGVSYYRGNDPAFVLPIFSQFDYRDTLSFFESMGILPTIMQESYCYPASKEAKSILSVLLMEIKRLHIQIDYEIGIRGIKKCKDKFVFDTKQGEYQSKACILATGGKSHKKTGSDGSGIPYVTSFFHQVEEFIPALVPMKAKESYFKELAGIRIHGKVELFIDNKNVCESVGEIQLTEYGISGIPVFQISRYASKAFTKKSQVKVRLNFMHHQKKKELYTYLLKRFHQKNGIKTAYESMIGLFPQKLIPILLKLSNIEEHKGAIQCDEKELICLTEVIQGFEVQISKMKSFDFSQVSAGGVLTSQINNESLESKLVKHLFFAGELIDIDGMCGGYNLQWAWSSGFVAGKHAGSVVK